MVNPIPVCGQVNYICCVHALTCLVSKASVPYDGVAEEEVISIALPVTVIFSVLGACGVVFAIICLLFNFIFRKYKSDVNGMQRGSHFLTG